MKIRLAWGLLWGLIVVVASLPLWVHLSAPEAAIAITDAVRVDGPDGPGRVALPAVQHERGGWAHYRLAFSVGPDTPRPLYLFIPLLSQRAVIQLDGHPVSDTGNRGLMVGLTSGTTEFVLLPSRLLKEGDNVIDLHLQAMGLVRGYLSPAYLGSAAELSPFYRLRVFLLEYLRLMVVAGQLLVTMVVFVVWLYRPKEALFGWLALLLLTSMFVYLGLLSDLHPRLSELLPYASMVGSSASTILVITVLLVCGLPVPRWLKWAVVVIPAVCLLLALTGMVPAHRLLLLVNAPLNILGLLAGLLLTGWSALVRRVSEAWLLLLPLLLAVLVALRDFAVVTGWLDGPVFLSVYYRPALLIGIAMILMRQLGTSLTQLDNVNAWLTRRLAEREAELERLHRDERREAAQRVRVEERQRLTVDLHDGLSGHLASIIALAERERTTGIERTAREALDDLRLVIHSLDINDRELTVALSGLRERLERQLKRMGVELDWSIAWLPEISGVTPTHALNVLRILQEAVTNAIRHGPATRILLRGDVEADGRARLVIENDGAPFTPQGRGAGLENMRRRAEQLGGEIRVEALETGTRLTLLLPPQLPEPGDAPA